MYTSPKKIKRNLLLRVIKALTLLYVFSVNLSNSYLKEKVVINHLNWNPSTIQKELLDKVRMLKIIHFHRSGGSNIASGLRYLRDTQPVRYHIRLSHAPIKPNNMENPGFGHEYVTKIKDYPKDDPWKNRVYNDIDAFFKQMNSVDDQGNPWGNIVDIAEFNIGWSGLRRHVDIDHFFDYYISRMESLIIKYPKCKFVHYTCNLKIDEKDEVKKLDNIARHLFNEKLRLYIEKHGGYLFDLADLQSHDENGVMQTFEYKNSKYPKLWFNPKNPDNPGWGDNTSHLNRKGQIYMALAKWSLWAAMIE